MDLDLDLALAAFFFFFSAGTLVALTILEAVVSVICLAAGRLEVM
jgi:hypothetical protein